MKKAKKTCWETTTKKADTLRVGLWRWVRSSRMGWVFYQDFFAGLTIASGLVVLGGLAAVAAGECAPAASIGLACAEAAAAGAATV